MRRMRRREHVGVLDADTDELGHVEEPPVVQERCAGTPRRELVVLTFERVREVGIGRADERERFVVVSHAVRSWCSATSAWSAPAASSSATVARRSGQSTGRGRPARCPTCRRRTSRRPRHRGPSRSSAYQCGLRVVAASWFGTMSRRMRSPASWAALGEGFEAGAPAELGVDGRAVDDVVSVPASRAAP